MKKMHKYIGLGQLSYFHLVLVLLPILTISGPFWIRRIPNSSKYNPVNIILNYIGTFIIAFIIDLIYLYINKSAKENQPLTSSISTVNRRVYFRPKTHAMLFILSFLDFIRLLGLVYLGSDDSFMVAQIELRTTELIFMSLLSKCILSTRLFRHHIASIISMIIGMLLTLFLAIKTIDLAFIYEVPLAILFYFFLSLKCIFDKWMMDIRFFPFHTLLLYESLYGIIISLGFFGFQTYIRCPIEWGYYCSDNGNYFRNAFKDFKVLFTKEKALLFPVIIYVFAHSINNVLMMLINKYLSPCHRAVSDTIAYFIWLSLLFFDYHQDTFSLSLFVIGYCIILFGSLVYNEVVILYFCELDYNVKMIISQRGENSILDIDKVNEIIIE